VDHWNFFNSFELIKILIIISAPHLKHFFNESDLQKKIAYIAFSNYLQT